MPILDRPVIVAVGVVYVVAILAVGLWSARRTRSPKDFWIAGQRIGLWITALATMSAAFSGFVFLGGPGLMYTMGLGSMFINASVGLTAGLLCWTVGKRLRLLAEVREVFTVPDAILHRFDSRLASGVAALSVLVGTIAYLGLQFLALGAWSRRSSEYPRATASTAWPWRWGLPLWCSCSTPSRAG